MYCQTSFWCRPRGAHICECASTSPGMSDASSDSQEITRLLHRWGGGDAAAADALFPLVYGELRRMAKQRLARERSDHTLQGTALVHEAFLKLVGPQREGAWNGRSHFYAAAAEAMRLGADGLLGEEGLHRMAPLPAAREVPPIPQPIEEPELEPSETASSEPAAAPEPAAAEPVLTADELRALLQDQPSMPPPQGPSES